MHLRTVLRAAYPHKGFIYAHERLLVESNRIEVTVRPRRGSRARCRHCGTPGPTYDTRQVREFDMVPILGFAVVLLYAMRRVNCGHCKRIATERLPWSIGGKSRLTSAFAHHLAGWARLLSWKEVGRRCGTGWDTVAQAVTWIVDYGLENRCLDGISAIGVDEIHIGKKAKEKFLTLVYQLDHGRRRLLWIGPSRTKGAFRRFFDMLGTDRCQNITFVCTDMWKAYLTVIAERLPNALNILDRFHIVSHLNQAVEETRRAEVTRLRAQGYEAHLKGSRWIWIKRAANLTRRQRTHLRELVRYNLATVKAYLLKETFDRFWSYTSPTWAGKFMDQWCRDVMRHRSLPHMKKFVRTLRAHRSLIMNYFKAKQMTGTTFSSGAVEGLNGKAKLCLRKSFGFRTDTLREVALYHALGRLPEPEETHRFA